MPEYTPLHKPGDTYTQRASAAVTGGRLLEVSGPNQVRHAVADSVAVVGVAAFDAASGEQVTLITGGVHRLTASGAVTAGARVAADTAGKVKTSAAPATGAQIGVAHTSVTTDGDAVEVAWIRA